MTLFKKIEIHFSSYLWLIFLLFTGQISFFINMFIILVAHELGHIIIIRLLNRKIYKIVIFPLGGVIDFEIDKNADLKEEFLIFLGGLLVNILICFLPLSEEIKIFNFSMLIFNALPIIPLDGGRILENLISRFFSFINTLKIMSIFSITVSISIYLYFLFITRNFTYFALLCYLLLEIVNYYSKINKRFNYFILNKYLYNNDRLKRRKVKNSNIPKNFYKGYNNYQNDKNEKYLLDTYFKKETNNNFDK